MCPQRQIAGDSPARVDEHRVSDPAREGHDPRVLRQHGEGGQPAGQAEVEQAPGERAPLRLQHQLHRLSDRLGAGLP